MAFKIRAHRREDEGYDFVYGKASKQLTAVCQKVGGVWTIVSGFGQGSIESSVKVSDIKAAWEQLAAAQYGRAQTPQLSAPPPRPAAGPPALARSGPPVRPTREIAGPITDDTLGLGFPERFPAPEKAAEGVARCPHCGQPFTGWTDATPEQVGDKRIAHNVMLPPCRCNVPNDESYTPDPLDYRMYMRDDSGQFTVLTPIGALDQVYAWMRRNREYVMTDGKLDPVWRDVQETLSRTTHYPEYRKALWE